MKLKLQNVRLSFPDLFVPRAFKPGDEPKYKATFLIEKGTAQAKAVEDAIVATAKEKWGAKAESVLKSIRGNPNKFCYQDGNTKDYEGYEGMMAFAASNKARPTVLDRDKTPLTQADGKPYAGCYVNAVLDLFCYDNSGNGISASLGGVQFAGDGDAFSGGRPASADEFDDVSEGSDAADLG